MTTLNELNSFRLVEGLFYKDNDGRKIGPLCLLRRDAPGNDELRADFFYVDGRPGQWWPDGNVVDMGRGYLPLVQEWTDPRSVGPLPVEMIVAAADEGAIKLTMIVAGQFETFTISRSAAASAIGRIADALSKPP